MRDVTMVSIVVATMYNAHNLHSLAPTEWHVWLARTAFGTGVIACAWFPTQAVVLQLDASVSVFVSVCLHVRFCPCVCVR